MNGITFEVRQDIINTLVNLLSLPIGDDKAKRVYDGAKKLLMEITDEYFKDVSTKLKLHKIS